MLVSETLGSTFPLLCAWESSVADAYGAGYDTWKGHAELPSSASSRGSTTRFSYRWVTEGALELSDSTIDDHRSKFCLVSFPRTVRVLNGANYARQSEERLI